jgi:hypothetical protein
MKKLLCRLIKISTRIAPVLAVVIGCITQPAQAAVQVTQFDPPLRISAWAAVPDNQLFNIVAADFNADGEPDFRLASGLAGIEAYFHSPTRFARRVPQLIPGVSQADVPIILDGGPVAAVPLNSRIGTNILSPGMNSFEWTPGYTNLYDLTQPLGDHEASVILASFLVPTQPGPIVIFSTNGTLVTNNPSLAIPASGDVLNREGVMAIEINFGGQPHYGYIHFDFRSNTGGIIGGAGGVIYGWAYETEPNVAIKAKPLSTARNRLRPSRIQIQPSTQPKLSD